VLEGIEWSLACRPTFRAKHVAGATWVVESPRDVEAPTIWVYYTIEGQRVTLRHFEIVVAWEG
jgi:hypothetical protein